MISGGEAMISDWHGITVRNRARHVGMSFEDYLLLPGYSFSYLNREKWGKAADIAETEAMKLGTQVDAILTQPSEADVTAENYECAREIAWHIKKHLGHVLPALIPQVSYTAEFVYCDHVLPVRGRLDFEIPGHLVLDLKVTESKVKQLEALITHMNYGDQVRGYGLMSGVDNGYIAAHCRPEKITSIKSVGMGLSPDFWQRKILKFGEQQ